MMATTNRDPARFPRNVTAQWINIFVHGRRLWSAAVVVNWNTHVSHNNSVIEYVTPATSYHERARAELCACQQDHAQAIGEDQCADSSHQTRGIGLEPWCSIRANYSPACKGKQSARRDCAHEHLV